MRWDGGELSVGMALQSPALMNRSMMSPAQQGQVGQVGGAAVQPMPQMMAIAPGQRPLAAREHTATIADRQGGPLGGLDDSAGPAHIQGLAGGAA